jgi:hypothetical protein
MAPPEALVAAVEPVEPVELFQATAERVASQATAVREVRAEPVWQVPTAKTREIPEVMEVPGAMAQREDRVDPGASEGLPQEAELLASMVPTEMGARAAAGATAELAAMALTAMRCIRMAELVATAATAALVVTAVPVALRGVMAWMATAAPAATAATLSPAAKRPQMAVSAAMAGLAVDWGVMELMAGMALTHCHRQSASHQVAMKWSTIAVLWVP